MKEIIRLKPVFKQMVWGGRHMRSEFGYDIPGDDTGECWAVSAHRNGDCTVNGGQWDGMKLSELWEEHQELFGYARNQATGGNRGVFPLLIKIIDATKDLSIQVHPDDLYAAEHENGALGKTECWYILDCVPGATIVIGHNARTKDELEDMILNNRWNEFIREIPIHKGDFFQIDPGTVHAIKGGTMILETQQNSDITYRVYDYGRLQNGKPRQLHVRQSIDVIKVPFIPDGNISRGNILKPGTAGTSGTAVCTPLISCDYYHVRKLDIDGKASYIQDTPFLICSCIEGKGTLDGEEIHKGEHFILPEGYGEFRLEGSVSMICSSVK